MKKEKIIFFGTEEFSAPTLRALIDAGYEVVAVITKPDAKKGRGQKIVEPIVKQIAKQNGIEVIQPLKITDEILPKAELGVLVSFGKIIPKKVIDFFPKGIINIHPSLLPKYRGPSPIESAIINCDDETGITIMQLAPEMDAGPILIQEKYKLNGNETKPELYEKFAKIGAEILLENLPKIISGEIKPVVQDEKIASYCKLLKKDDGILDAKNNTAEEIDAKVRAYLGYPKTRLNDLIITKTKVLEFNPGDNWPDILNCANETALQIEEVVSPKSGKKMKYADYLRGNS